MNRKEALRKAIFRHNHNYYVLSEPTISDFEYDMLLKELEELEKEDPDSEPSPTKEVGSDLRTKITPLYNVPPKSYIRVLDDILFFDHLDGAYSYCTDTEGNAVLLSGYTMVEWDIEWKEIKCPKCLSQYDEIEFDFQRCAKC